MLIKLLLCVAVIATTIAAAQPQQQQRRCRFAPDFTASDILHNATARRAFLHTYAMYESNFTKHLGVNPETQLTYDGHRLSAETGLPLGTPHRFSAASKESFHVALLARVLEGTDPYSRTIYTVDEALATLETKVTSYETFFKRFPGFGGFLPWFAFNYDANGTFVDVTPAWNWQDQTPSLDNGELFWSAFAVSEILLAQYSRTLGERWERVWKTMAQNAKTVFYAGDGELRTVTVMTNQSLPVSENKYTALPHNPQPFLDDPLEGELMTVAVYLFSPDLDAEQKNLLWIKKRAKLQPAELVVPTASSQKILLTQRGWWFSAHESFKYLSLPYRLSAVNFRVFRNGERARTWFGNAVRQSPGLWASVNGPVRSDTQNFPYDSACGIQPLAFERVLHDDVLTPYGIFPTFLAGTNSSSSSSSSSSSNDTESDTEAIAAAWLHRMMLGPRMQNQFGTTESTFANGTACAPLCTWDSKTTTLLALIGGVVDLVESGLRRRGVLDKFVAIVDREWGRVFFPKNNSAKTLLPGEDLPFLGPPEDKFIPRAAPDFSSCRT